MFKAKKNNSLRWQLRNRPNWFDPEYLAFEKKLALVRFEQKTFPVSGVVITTKLKVQETLRIHYAARYIMTPVVKVVYGKKTV